MDILICRWLSIFSILSQLNSSIGANRVPAVRLPPRSRQRVQNRQIIQEDPPLVLAPLEWEIPDPNERVQSVRHIKNPFVRPRVCKDERPDCNWYLAHDMCDKVYSLTYVCKLTCGFCNKKVDAFSPRTGCCSNDEEQANPPAREPPIQNLAPDTDRLIQKTVPNEIDEWSSPSQNGPPSGKPQDYYEYDSRERSVVEIPRRRKVDPSLVNEVPRSKKSRGQRPRIRQPQNSAPLQNAPAIEPPLPPKDAELYDPRRTEFPTPNDAELYDAKKSQTFSRASPPSLASQPQSPPQSQGSFIYPNTANYAPGTIDPYADYYSRMVGPIHEPATNPFFSAQAPALIPTSSVAGLPQSYLVLPQNQQLSQIPQLPPQSLSQNYLQEAEQALYTPEQLKNLFSGQGQFKHDPLASLYPQHLNSQQQVAPPAADIYPQPGVYPANPLPRDYTLRKLTHYLQTATLLADLLSGPSPTLPQLPKAPQQIVGQQLGALPPHNPLHQIQNQNRLLDAFKLQQRLVNLQQETAPILQPQTPATLPDVSTQRTSVSSSFSSKSVAETGGRRQQIDTENSSPIVSSQTLWQKLSPGQIRQFWSRNSPPAREILSTETGIDTESTAPISRDPSREAIENLSARSSSESASIEYSTETQETYFEQQTPPHISQNLNQGQTYEDNQPPISPSFNQGRSYEDNQPPISPSFSKGRSYEGSVESPFNYLDYNSYEYSVSYPESQYYASSQEKTHQNRQTANPPAFQQPNIFQNFSTSNSHKQFPQIIPRSLQSVTELKNLFPSLFDIDQASNLLKNESSEIGRITTGSTEKIGLPRAISVDYASQYQQITHNLPVENIVSEKKSKPKIVKTRKTSRKSSRAEHAQKKNNFVFPNQPAFLPEHVPLEFYRRKNAQGTKARDESSSSISSDDSDYEEFVDIISTTRNPSREIVSAVKSKKNIPPVRKLATASSLPEKPLKLGKNRFADCCIWASRGFCESKQQWMVQNCAKACTNSGCTSCIDEYAECASWADFGICELNPNYMNIMCRKSCKVCTVK